MITVLFFAHLQEKTGQGRIDVDEVNISIRDLKDKLQGEYNLTQMDQVMVAINGEYARDDDIIKDGDVVALIPPVSGG